MTITTPDLNKTSHSEVESFLMCERRHYYAYGKRLQSKSPSRDLVRGLLGHSGLEFYYNLLKANKSTNIKDFINPTRELVFDNASEYGETGSEMAGEVAVLLTEYIKYYFERDREMQILEVEGHHKIPINEQFYIEMVVDLVARTWNGIVAFDHKFTYDFYSPIQLRLNPQLPKYVKALELAGLPVDKAYYNLIRYRVTKDNRDNPEAKFRREQVPLSANRVERTINEQIEVAKEILTLKDWPLEVWEESVVRTANNMACQRCPFKTICAMDLEGKDTTLEEQFSFKTKE